MFKLFCLVGLLFYKFAGAEIDIPELKYLDKSVDPCDDFYKFTCGNFKDVHPLPDGAKYIDEFSILQETIHQKAEEILEIPISDKDPVALKKAKAFHRSCLDMQYTDRLEFPFLAVLDDVGEWPVISPTYRKENSKPTWPQIGDYIARYGIPFFFDLEIMPSHRTNSNVIYLTADGLSNPEAGIYARISEDFDFLAAAPREKRDAEEDTPYFDFLKKMAMELKRITMSYKREWEIVKDLRSTIEFMDLVRYGGHPPTEEISKLPSEATITQLQNWTDIYFGDEIGLNWADFLNHALKYSGVKITKDTVVMQSNIKWIWGLLELYRRSEGADILNYVVARLLTFTAPDGNTFMRSALREFYEVFDHPVFERNEYCLRKTLGYPDRIDFSYAVTYAYQQFFWNVNKLEPATLLEKDLEYVAVDVIKNLPWMDAEAKEKAKRKVYDMRALIGYPSKIVPKAEVLDEYYENLRVCSWDHFGNSQRLRAFNRAKNFMEIGNNQNRQLWSVSPLVVNAFYNRANNKITLPVSILNPAFYGNGNSSLLNFARLGAIIGHEITHGFDDTGRLYDEEGKLVIGGWWSEETSKNFVEHAKCFKEQYDDYVIEQIEANVNGTKTLNENLADNGGLKLAYKAWVRRQSPEITETKEEFTKEQLFFIGYGTMWCSLETEEYLSNQHEKTAYSPARYRVIGSVSNMKEFSDAFHCQEKSNMNPETKCTLW